MCKRQRLRGALLLDVLMALGLLSILSLVAGRLLLGGMHVLRAQARSAQAVVQTREALAALARDVPQATRMRGSAGSLTVVLADSRKAMYRDRESGLTRTGPDGAITTWPSLRAEFALAKSGLVDVTLSASRSDGRPALVCESAFWARASSTGRAR
jgi:hypothetical protein